MTLKTIKVDNVSRVKTFKSRINVFREYFDDNETVEACTRHASQKLAEEMLNSNICTLKTTLNPDGYSKDLELSVRIVDDPILSEYIVVDETRYKIDHLIFKKEEIEEAVKHYYIERFI